MPTINRLLPKRNSNWEVVVFALLSTFVLKPQTTFYRPQLMSQDNQDWSLKLLSLLGHNGESNTPENTIQATLQKMRDRGYVSFRGNGKYQLTEDGFSTMQAIKQELASRFGSIISNSTAQKPG